MSDFSLRVVRSDDLLILTFEFFNLVLDAQGTSPRRLVRRTPGQEARMVVHFPPQHILEEAFAANVGPPTVVNSIRSRISGPTRLAFRVPANISSITLSLEAPDGLLDWNRLEPIVVGPPADAESSGAPSEPAISETSVELPARLVLSPMAGAKWNHRKNAFGPAGVFELWHTSHSPGTGQPPEFGLRAVWTPDLTTSADSFTSSLNSSHRTQIVRLSSDLRLLDPANFSNLSSAQAQKLADLRRQRSSQLLANELRLSAFGGSLRVRSKFRFPSVPDDLLSRSRLPRSAYSFSLEDWSHHVVAGRDQYARTVVRGFLHPFGHAATVVTITERKMYAGASGLNRGGFLIQRQQLFVQEPVRSFTSRAIPFATIRITDLTVVADVADASRPYVPKIGPNPFKFSLTATDPLGGVHQFATALVFVPQDQAWDTGTIADLYAPHTTVDFASQSIAYAKPSVSVADDSSGAALGPTTLRTLAMAFRAQIRDGIPVPEMAEATVGVPAAEQLMGAAAAPVKIQLNKKFISGGMAPANNVFADIQGQLAANLPATSAGGLATPDLKMTALSQTQGAFPDVRSLTPEQIKELFQGRLLGVIRLSSILDLLDLKGLPEIKPEPGQRMSFFWKPKLAHPLPAPMEQEGTQTSALTLSGSIAAPSTGGQVNIEGKLENVALSFMGVLRIGFSELRFNMASGQDPKFDPTITSVGFRGELKFVEKLQSLLKDAFGGSGPIIKVTPEGASAGVALALPMIPLGPLILSNLALSATLNLYFTGKPTSVTFGLSTAKDPFLITYTIFGGGGYFLFTADTNGDVAFEALLEFGGAVAIDIGVARGSVQAMVGIGFKAAEGTWKLWGQVRVYGLLEVLEVITISVEFYLKLEYQDPVAIGRAILIVMVRVLAFSKSVTLEVERQFTTQDGGLALSADPIPLADWREYCDAFAPV